MHSKLTPLYERHVALHGKMVDFAGYLLPMQFGGIIEEHMAVRNAAGIFDVSHMARVRVSGDNAEHYVQTLSTNDISTLGDGRCRYTFLCNESGGILDDILVYRKSAKLYLLVINAANAEKIHNHMMEHLIPGVEVDDLTSRTAQMALQGPHAQAILDEIVFAEHLPQKYYSFTMQGIIGNHTCIISRTGYTGEDGFEIYCHDEHALDIYDEIMRVGQNHGLKPCGLGARDTLRMEAGMPLYGHELGEDINPFEAGLGMFVKPMQGDFIGKHALMQALDAGIGRKRIGMQMIDKGIPRQGYEVYQGDAIIGQVTSGGFCPALGGNYAMALVQTQENYEDLSISIREKKAAAQRVDLPFYKREK
ncbi:glycine cleavage system aminomethyltransferase GcvT [Eubacteriales bacterium OttesenSCG-928-N14]|nr:glycine cleavage system aminomethyltransferase GcvT [Eubacteriales bacterium OttesenSCG-928-N14]